MTYIVKYGSGGVQNCRNKSDLSAFLAALLADQPAQGSVTVTIYKGR